MFVLNVQFEECLSKCTFSPTKYLGSSCQVPLRIWLVSLFYSLKSSLVLKIKNTCLILISNLLFNQLASILYTVAKCQNQLLKEDFLLNIKNMGPCLCILKKCIESISMQSRPWTKLPHLKRRHIIVDNRTYQPYTLVGPPV